MTAGEVLIDGTRANEKEPMDRDIAMVFQNYALYPHMSVRQNMGYGLKIAGVSKEGIAEKVAEAARLLELGRNCWTEGQGNCPAASASVWQWGGR